MNGIKGKLVSIGALTEGLHRYFVLLLLKCDANGRHIVKPVARLFSSSATEGRNRFVNATYTRARATSA